MSKIGKGYRAGIASVVRYVMDMGMLDMARGEARGAILRNLPFVERSSKSYQAGILDALTAAERLGFVDHEGIFGPKVIESACLQKYGRAG